MAEYLYRVKDQSGRVQEAVAQAESQSALRARLSARGMEVVDIRPRAGPAPGGGTTFLARFEQVKLRDMVVFSRQFAAMVGSGVAMLRALTIMVEQCENAKM